MYIAQSSMYYHYIVSCRVWHTPRQPFNFFRVRRSSSRDFVGQAIHIGLFFAAGLSWKPPGKPIQHHKTDRWVDVTLPMPETWFKAKKEPSHSLGGKTVLSLIDRNHTDCSPTIRFYSRTMNRKWWLKSSKRFKVKLFQAQWQSTNPKTGKTEFTGRPQWPLSQCNLPHNGWAKVLHLSSLKRSLPETTVKKIWDLVGHIFGTHFFFNKKNHVFIIAYHLFIVF